jgi:hypothetical protein
MLWGLLFCAAILLAVVPLNAADDSGVRELPTAGLTKFGEPALPKLPVVIKTREELEKLITDKPTVDALMKEVDLDKEWLAFFRWSGSGQDRLVAKLGDPENGGRKVTFDYTMGRTKDLRQHAKLFAVSRDISAPD